MASDGQGDNSPRPHSLSTAGMLLFDSTMASTWDKSHCRLPVRSLAGPIIERSKFLERHVHHSSPHEAQTYVGVFRRSSPRHNGALVPIVIDLGAQ